jgi:hypothetical protein
MPQRGRRGCRSRGGEPIETASRAPPVASGRDVPASRRRRTCPAHTLRPPLCGRPGGCGGVLPNCGGWTIPRRTSCAQLEMLTHRCPLPRVKYCPHKTGHADCGRGRRGERTPPEGAGGDLTDAPDRGSASVAMSPALRLSQPLKRCSADKQLNQQSISPAGR